jgi:hypothetical protein
MTTLLICAAFVYGVSTVIDLTTSFFGLDLDKIYEGKKPPRSSAFDRDPIDYKENPLFLKFIYRPLFYCNVCMSSVWGSIYYVVSFGFVDPWSWILHCVISAGLIQIVNRYV